MKYLKLFENYTIESWEFPNNAPKLSSRELSLLPEADKSFYDSFEFRKDDGYYYSLYFDTIFSYDSTLYNKFDTIFELVDYVKFIYYTREYSDSYKSNLLELIKKSKIDLTFDQNFLCYWATKKSNLDVLRALVEENFDITYYNNLPLRIAAEDGNIEVFKFLLKYPQVNPGDFDNGAIKSASRQGHVEMVKILLKDKRVDPTVNDNRPIRVAGIFNNLEVIDVLLKDPRVYNSLSYGEREFYTLRKDGKIE